MTESQPDPLLRVLVDVATAIAERKRLERAERRRRLAFVDQAEKPEARTLRWHRTPRAMTDPTPWDLVLVGSLAWGERPPNLDELLAYEGELWTVAEWGMHAERETPPLWVLSLVRASIGNP